GDLVGGHHPRAEAAGACEVLAGGPLDGVALPVTHRAVVVAAIAGDVIPRILLGNSPSSPANDDRDLCLVVEVRRFARTQDRLLVAYLRFAKAQEQRRLLGLVASGLLTVLLVVEADADDLVGIGDHRQPRHV